MTNNKYLIFYKSVKNTLLDLRLCSFDDLEGVSEYDIAKLEEKLNIKIPLSLSVFLQFFGKKRISIFPELTITISDIEEAQKQKNAIVDFFIKQNFVIDSDGMKGVNGRVDYIEYVDGNYIEEQKINLLDIFDIDKILFIHSQFKTILIDLREENPVIHFLDTDNSFTSSRLHLTDYIRSVIFNKIKPKLEEQDFSRYEKEKHIIMYNLGEKIMRINLDNTIWAKKYMQLLKKEGDKNYKIYESRENFYHLNNEHEEKTGYIMTIDEFEWAFIDYLREQGYEF